MVSLSQSAWSWERGSVGSMLCLRMARLIRIVTLV